ncbi:protein-L-isoaspartate O-methyltransferase family protein [Blastochloris viridis]|uniref:Protein-L-isoaspartate O-methyltransferase n=1 Tax=Blastochloris viridis TaxID=1079 RepID=A0A0H5BF05_BLAVI|nr:protein-L-isoaspartate O-methyltransferase [Blastochloris viridis]ALK09319.1 Protein-L-isoaspartate O-methyltransferase [Blastochloris viridis]BAS00803.1 protein-L-isoaspartate O-methyltransferase [Blastochloris viridis]CUU41982.1 Protein-L-isoaspartate O-methyltransferase [Blastochloris viridis]
MIDFVTLRRNMVNGQIRTNGVSDPAVIAALSELPRELFVPEPRRALAYLDDDIAVGGDGEPRFLLEPMILALIVQAAGLKPSDRVLDIGCTTGYSTAVLARLAGSVVGLESDGALAETARDALQRVGVANAAVVNGPLTAGWPQDGPYDAIFFEGAVEQVPPSLLGQLSDEGRLVAVINNSGAGRVTLFRSVGGTVSSLALFNAAVPLLPGFAKPKGFVF